MNGGVYCFCFVGVFILFMIIYIVFVILLSILFIYFVLRNFKFGEGVGCMGWVRLVGF